MRHHLRCVHLFTAGTQGVSHEASIHRPEGGYVRRGHPHPRGRMLAEPDRTHAWRCEQRRVRGCVGLERLFLDASEGAPFIGALSILGSGWIRWTKCTIERRFYLIK